LFVERAEKLPWSYPVISHNFEAGMKRFIRYGLYADLYGKEISTQTVQKLDEFAAWRRTTQRFADSPEDISMIGRDIFNGEFQALLKEAGILKTDFQSDLLKKGAGGIFKTKLPDHLGANAIFDKFDTPEFEIINRSISGMQPIRRERNIQPKLGVSRLVSCLSSLDYNDVGKIRDSDEFKSFINATDKGLGNDANRDELADILEAHVIKIEETILAKFGFTPATDGKDSIKIQWFEATMDAAKRGGSEFVSYVLALDNTTLASRLLNQYIHLLEPMVEQIKSPIYRQYIDVRAEKDRENRQNYSAQVEEEKNKAGKIEEIDPRIRTTSAGTPISAKINTRVG
jgi:hypothetical protein